MTTSSPLCVGDRVRYEGLGEVLEMKCNPPYGFYELRKHEYISAGQPIIIFCEPYYFTPDRCFVRVGEEEGK